MALGASILAYSLVAVNDYIPTKSLDKLKWLYSGGPEGARSVLSTIAGSVVTVAGTVFSITIAALTLASSQFGPRLLRTFRRDTGNQIVLGTFISTFLYCLLVLRTVLGTDKNQFVPGAAVTVGVLLAVLSLAVLIYFIHHTAASIQVSNLMESVERELNSTIENNLPDRGEKEAPSPRNDPPRIGNAKEIKTREGGYLLHVDYESLIHHAARMNGFIHIYLRPGNFSLVDFPLAAITPAAVVSADEDYSSLYGCFYFGSERTPEQDPEHAFLQLAEIAVRALSPGINDPFTAIACLDKITQSMALVARRRIDSRFLYDERNTLRVVAVRVQYEELVIAGFQFIRKAALGNREVLNHLASRLKMLLERADDPDLRSALERQLSRTEENIQACEL